MSGEHSTLVNQKLAFAKSLRAQACQDGQQSVLVKACLEGACLQLHIAYGLYLREIAAQYSLPDGFYHSTEDLQAVFAEQGRISPEVTELSELQSRSVSWLSYLLDAHQCVVDPGGNNSALGETPLPATDDKSKGGAVLIGAVELNMPTLSCASLEEWLTSFEALITRHRESMQEC